jgi:hypothetical protein
MFSTATAHKTYISFSCDICGSVHHHSFNKTTNVMQLVTFVFISCYVLYMFRVLFAPILRSILKLYMQSFVPDLSF